MKSLSLLLTENGKLVVTLRHGCFDDRRETFGVSVDEIKQLAEANGLFACLVADGEDSLKRAGIAWQTVVLESNNPV